MSRRKAPEISAEAKAVLETLVPTAVHSEDAATRNAVMEAARLWVEAAAPQSAQDASGLLRAGAEHALAVLRADGYINTEEALQPDTIERLAVRENPDAGNAHRGELRRRLTRLGRAANRMWWPLERERLGKAETPEPYGDDAEEGFRLHGLLRGGPARLAEAAVICFSGGAGMSGAEIHLVTPDRVVPRGEGGLAVNVEGKHPRLVPMRRSYTELTKRLLADTRGGPFFKAKYANRVYGVAERITARDGGHLLFRRTRTTWLQAHIRAGVPLDMLRKIAGPVSTNTLDDLIAMSAVEVDPKEAVLAGLETP